MTTTSVNITINLPGGYTYSIPPAGPMAPLVVSDAPPDYFVSFSGGPQNQHLLNKPINTLKSTTHTPTPTPLDATTRTVALTSPVPNAPEYTVPVLKNQIVIPSKTPTMSTAGPKPTASLGQPDLITSLRDALSTRRRNLHKPIEKTEESWSSKPGK